MSQERQSFCSNCGQQMEEGGRFCSSCGHSNETTSRPAGVAATESNRDSISYLPPGISDDLPSMVRTELSKLPAERQSQFLEEYERRAKTMWLAYVLWILTLQYAYVGKWGVNLIFWASFFLLIGFVWWVIDIFRVYGMVKNYNRDIAISVMRDLRILTQP